MQKNNIDKNHVSMVEGNSSILFFYKNSENRGDFKFINSVKYLNIKGWYHDCVNIKNNENWDNSYIVEFDLRNIDREFIISIFDYQINQINIGKCLTYADALEQTFNYFANDFKKSFKNKILGDIGEAVFILKTFEFTKKNRINNLHKNDNGLCDFKFQNNSFIEIKSTSSDKNEIILTNCQADYVENKKFVVVKFKTIPKCKESKTIIDLYNEIKNAIGPLNELIKSNYEFYQNIKEIEHFSVNLDQTTIHILNDDSVPSYEIINVKSIKKVKFYLDVTDNLGDFKEFIQTFEFDKKD